jgi:hypothetical protein
MPRDNKRDYKVGRGKPPLKTRFKPGQSGNPRGRPKGRRGISALLQAELQTLIKVTEDGQTKRMTKLQAIVKRLVNALLKGDPKAFALFARLTNPDEERESLAAETPLSDREKQLLHDFMNVASGRRRR